MDSLYRQAAPKPFSKFPYGYRPIAGSLSGSSPASPQKSFGSLSSILSTYDNYARNLPNPQESTINGAISLSELNRTYPGSIEPPIPPVRAGSLDPESDYPIARNIPIARPVGFKDDTVYVGSAVSSRAGSPMRATFSPSSREGGSQRSIYSPPTFDIGSPEPRSPPNYSNQRNFRYNHHQYEVPPDANTSFENSNYDNYYTNENQSYPNYIQQNVNPYHQQPPVYHQNYSNQNYYENQNHQNNRLNHDAYAYSNGANRRADEFLEKLRRHKDELERSLNQPRPKDSYYHEKLPYEELLSTANTENHSNYNELANSLPLDYSTRNDDCFDDRHMSYGNSYNNRPQHQPLHKTVSDPAVQPHFSNSSNQFQTLASPRRSQNLMTQSYDENFNRREDFEGTYPMSRSAMASTRRRYGSLMEDDGLLGQSIRHQQKIQEITDNDIRPKHQNHVSDNDLNQRGGFFASKLIDANWMVDPPPPIDINPRNPGSQRNQTPRKPPAYDVLRESNEHRRSQIPTPSSYRDRINQPATIDENRILKIYDPENWEDQRKRRSQLPVPTYDKYRNVPQENQTQLSPLRLSTEYQENRGHQNQNDYYGPPQRQSSYQEMPFKEKLPSPRYNSAQNLQQNRFDNDYGNSNPPPLITTYRNPAYQRSQDQSFFGPVESKIFEPSSPTIINGFTTQAQPTTKLQSDDRQNPGSSQNSARTFALVSRVPEDASKLMQPLQIQPESRRYGNRPGCGKFPDLSPTSVYDNDATDSDATRSPPELKNLSNTNTSSSSEEDQKGYTDDEAYRGFSSHQSRSRIPQLRNERINSILKEHSMQPARSRSPNGILKKGTGQRSNKKVVFQCEPEISSKQLGFRLENLKNGMLEAAASAEAPPHVRAFDDVMEEPLRKWCALSDQLGGDVTQMKSKVESVFADLRNFLWTAAGRAEPAANEVQNLLAPIVKGLGDISAYKDTKRNTPMFNHLSAVAEGVPAVGWVLVKKTPAPYVKEMLDAAMFYVNRILKEFKDGNQTNVEWAKTWKELLETMQTFVRQTHTTGLVWNSAPGSVPEGGSSAPKPPAGGPAPPPPPPPPPADIFADIPKSQNQSQADKDKTNRDALFAQLNRGEAVTSGLKKVTSDMQTHKNPSLRASSTVSGTSVSPGGGSPAKSPTAPVKKPPKTELQDGKTWIVEYHVGNPNIIIDVTDKKQTVYVFRCENSVVKVNGKLNSITLDQCKKTSVVFDALVSQCETINCQSVQIQTLGEMPTLSIQKTDGCQVYLSEAAKNAEIVTSKSSEMNILIPVANDDYQEFPVPEQFKTTFKNGKLHTEVSDIC